MLRKAGFDSALAFGQEGEQLIAAYLLDRGVAVQPLYQFDGHSHAPVILWSADGATARRAAPDLTCWKDGECFFVEVKRKTRWVGAKGSWRWDSGAPRGLETGLNDRLYRAYCDIQDRTGAAIWIFFLHETQPPLGLYLIELSVARSVDPRGKVARYWNGRGRGGQRIEPPEMLFPLEYLERRAWPLREAA